MTVVTAIDVHEYCRAVEAHLCRRNGGHLIRIVGPSFDLVKSWAEAGIPLAVAQAGIDRRVDRAERTPGRRRPLRIEFCDADVRDLFDEWRRAVGTAIGPIGEAGADADVSSGRRGSLVQHIDRAVVQLTALRGGGRVPAALEPALAAAVATLDAQRAAGATARGAARDAILEALQAADAALGQAALAAHRAEALAALRREAEAELAGYRARLAPAQWDASVAAGTARLARLRLGLPTLAFD